MRSPIFSTLREYFRTANQWFFKTPERALDEAYEAALMIKAIEDAHFGGGRISPDFGNYSQSERAVFQEDLKTNLSIVKLRLAEFRFSRLIMRISNRPITEVEVEDEESEGVIVNVIDKQAVILRKLRIIDEVIARYENVPSSSSLIVVPESSQLELNGQTPRSPRTQSNLVRAQSGGEDVASIVDKTGVLPRSILKTVDRIKRELDPNAEEEVVENFRNSKARTVISLRLVLLLIIVPLLTQQLTKNFIVGPIVDRFRSNEEAEVFLNPEMEEEALTKLHHFEEQLRFRALVGQAPALNDEEIETQVREKAIELQEEFRYQSNDAVKNVFADIFSIAAFAGIIITSQREIAVLKSFIDELVYGLSDSAKAFIIILFTDTFVGFHSPHGWEVLLEGIAKHLGLPANRSFIFLFIATFPVILDTIFKYWIFRYLNRISPSAVATYRNMNE
ncbi:proton extrusion protein PcxA [Oscillatoria sp. FACHB-1407]|uniref:proton extrusion protein PcxA n=1 Tax=Oscillatoria sp. FACHB-1407 TaxID=2692847 RepID=UPI001683D264|nr:proton extrusion protein PcxA [Oscillatoria sp. FACHB-1407]MBD2460199.1 proton extrusion protein PcxA [Oscillatoria sp. FACHB-1407]